MKIEELYVLYKEFTKRGVHKADDQTIKTAQQFATYCLDQGHLEALVGSGRWMDKLDLLRELAHRVLGDSCAPNASTREQIIALAYLEHAGILEQSKNKKYRLAL